MKDRAYSLLEIKQVDEESRVIEGIASTPTPDRMGDVVEPMGAKFALPMPLLHQHDHNRPVGHVEFAEPTSKGIPFRAKLVTVDEPGELKDRVDLAWQEVKAGLVRAVSIGFRAIGDQVERLKEGGLRFKEWEWLELSLVTIPANSEATITTIKSFDRLAMQSDEPLAITAETLNEQRSANGLPEIPADDVPAATGKSARVVKLDEPARVRAKPFVIRSIKRT